MFSGWRIFFCQCLQKAVRDWDFEALQGKVQRLDKLRRALKVERNELRKKVQNLNGDSGAGGAPASDPGTDSPSPPPTNSLLEPSSCPVADSASCHCGPRPDTDAPPLPALEWSRGHPPLPPSPLHVQSTSLQAAAPLLERQQLASNSAVSLCLSTLTCRLSRLSSSSDSRTSWFTSNFRVWTCAAGVSMSTRAGLMDLFGSTQVKLVVGEKRLLACVCVSGFLS